jgi:hypothetical protein
VAIHAGLSGWNVGEAGNFDRGMAVAAVNAKAAHMVRVTEWNRLFAGLRRARDIVRPAQPVSRPNHKTQYKHGAKNGDPCESIRAVMENLGHGLPASPVKHQKCVVSHQEKQLTQFS